MKNKKIFVTHQTRPENVEKLQMFYAQHKIRANVLSFIRDMASVITDADLVVGRSGASTVIELETIGRPAILVPLNINPDQAANAASFAKLGGGFAIEQDKFSHKWLASTLDDLFDNPARLDKMADKAYVKNDAVKKISDTIIKNAQTGIFYFILFFACTRFVFCSMISARKERNETSFIIAIYILYVYKCRNMCIFAGC